MNETNSRYGLIVISAPSGAGKSTLCAKLLEDFPARLALSVSTTSRAPRGQEQNGREYFFTDSQDFQARIAADEFAEWALVHGNYYGTQKATLERFWASSRHVLLDIDVQGAASLKGLYGDRCFTVFIAPPSMEELERRLRGRGTDSEETIRKRMANAAGEMARQVEFDRIIVNEDFARARAELDQAVRDFMDAQESGKWLKAP
jgi:guanylate kinase